VLAGAEFVTLSSVSKMLVEYFYQVLLVDRLGYKVVHTGGDTFVAIFLHGVGG
jgi:hypothetical protein